MKCPDAIIPGRQWIGGVKKPKPTSEISHAAVAVTSHKCDSSDLRKELGSNAAILDLAITDATARAIGIECGLSASYAEKRGTALVDRALDALIAAAELTSKFIETKDQKSAA
jgi:hypothetical protein